ncbi:MAG TPA: hypothetical protein VGR43_09445 [Dehalococcoidia bacterium]|jgi:hypothetical protein|nr:hypothetical protein [Dehalococcoidia bacterium]
MPRPVELDADEQMRQRSAQFREFCEAVLDLEERPWFVSDAATVYDIYAGDIDELRRRCGRHCGVWLELAWLEQPIWQLLDHLHGNRAG